MSTLERVRRTIGRYKEKLESRPICENFGQQEVRKLRNQYNYYTLSDIPVNERNDILDAIDNFDEWCITHC